MDDGGENKCTGILDETLAGDTSSVYTMTGASDGPNAMCLPSKVKKIRPKQVVTKLPSKRSLRAMAHQKTKERLKSIREEVSKNLQPLSKTHDEAIRLLSHLLNAKSLCNTKFEELYAKVVESGAKIPDSLIKKHEKILKIIERAQTEEADF